MVSRNGNTVGMAIGIILNRSLQLISKFHMICFSIFYDMFFLEQRAYRKQPLYLRGKVASSALRFGPKLAMQLAERLYTQAIHVQKARHILLLLTSEEHWCIIRYLVTIISQRQETDAGDHPPITPMCSANDNGLGNDAWKLTVPVHLPAFSGNSLSGLQLYKHARSRRQIVPSVLIATTVPRLKALMHFLALVILPSRERESECLASSVHSVIVQGLCALPRMQRSKMKVQLPSFLARRCSSDFYDSV
ncbi:hypothetical protein CQW23_32809 [Capsicum baccatum]|uniref:Uncharacterized protein n=1 Tax=Capsicum baccatum TaxID=33114 RepID=A0A2G2V3N2_CAPBA|nr:hypothetical protein CQW23_32809 [Capsicum baccatum]